MKKYLTDENIKNADLIAVFQRCPFNEPINDCPFVPYHQLNDIEEQIRLLNTLSEDTLQQLRSWHRSCIALRQSQMNSKTTKINVASKKNSQIISFYKRFQKYFIR